MLFGNEQKIDRRARSFLIRVLLVTVICLVFGSSCGDSIETEKSSEVKNKSRETEKGEEIMAEYLKRDFSPFRKNKVRLTITPKTGSKKIYVLETWRKQIEGETLTLTHILKPAEDRNIATLTIEKKGEPTVNVSYIASRKRFRESGTNKMFFGGLTSQELLGEWGKYDSKLLSENEGRKIFVVESTLKSASKSVIKRIITHFDAADYLPKELHLFNSNYEEIRTFNIEKYRTVGDKKVVSKTTIKNHIYNATITIEVLEISFPENLPDNMFEQKYLMKFAK